MARLQSSRMRLPLVVLFFVVGCSPIPRADGGVPLDAGLETDSGLELDAGADAGVGSDAGAEIDAGSRADGGSEVFALLDPFDDAARVRTYLQRAEVAGVAWRGLWKQVEPSDGTWDWSRLDTALDEAADAGKRVTIHLGSSGGGWPTWLTTAGVATYAGTTPLGPVTDPVPWDATYLARYSRLMQTLATHLTARNATARVRAVSVGAPVSEMSLVGCTQGVLGTSPTSVAYDRARYLGAWSTAAQAVMTAFPANEVVVSAPVPVICRPDSDGAAFFRDLMTPLARASIFAADLKASGSQRAGQIDATLRGRPLLFQTIWSSTNDPTNRLEGTLSSAVCSGLALGARYFELYKADLDSTTPALQRAVRQAGGAEPCP